MSDKIRSGWAGIWGAGFRARFWQGGEHSAIAGDVRDLLRNGVLVGAAAQPRMRQGLLGVQAALRYRF